MVKRARTRNYRDIYDAAATGGMKTEVYMAQGCSERQCDVIRCYTGQSGTGIVSTERTRGKAGVSFKADVLLGVFFLCFKDRFLL